MKNTVRIAYETSGPRKLAGTITVSGDLLKSETSPTDLAKEFIKRQHGIDDVEVVAAVISEAA